MLTQVKKIIRRNDRAFAYLKRLLLYVRYMKSFLEKNRYRGIHLFTGIENTFSIGMSNYHCFFGYYDKSPISADGRSLLFIKVRVDVQEGDDADICVYDIVSGTNSVLGKTNSWNWQQGAMEQWIDNKTLSYNRYNVERGFYETVVYSIESKEERILQRATYAYNKDYSKSLSLNFHRLDILAKGYGYPFEADSMNVSEDGIWETNVVTGETSLLLSLADVVAYHPHYINHVTYCPDENYVMFIHRWQEHGGTFTSRLLLFNKKEHSLSIVLDNGHVSHYCWKTDRELLIYATNGRREKGYMLVDIYSGTTELLTGLPIEDGHPSYSNERRWILTDTYPDRRRYQYLFLFDTKEKQLLMVDRLHSPFKYYNDYRCDLHPRWSMDNRYIVVDNTSTGVRTLKVYKLK